MVVKLSKASSTLSAVKQNKEARVYFPGLNGLRFLAAFAVIITHVELIKKLEGFTVNGWVDLWGRWGKSSIPGVENSIIVPAYPISSVIHDPMLKWYQPAVAEAGGLGVIFFFVLSGFLITYLLFKERQSTGSIGIKAFYMRRIFRIWPLYYLVVVSAFLVVRHVDFFYVNYTVHIFETPDQIWKSFLLYLVMLPNLALAAFRTMPHVGQAWSIGVEEQFYLIWPWLIRKARLPLRMMLVFVSVMILLKIIVFLFSGAWGRTGEVLSAFIAMSKLESMAIGGIGAWLLFTERHALLRLIYLPVTQILAYLSIPFLIYFTPRLVQDIVYLAYSASFLIIILNVSSNPKSLISLENKIMHELGKISYGIYMYHMLMVTIAIEIFERMIGKNVWIPIWENLLIYPLSLILTLGVSYLSYHFFEKRFIKMKTPFTRVLSGDMVKQQR